MRRFGIIGLLLLAVTAIGTLTSASAVAKKPASLTFGAGALGGNLIGLSGTTFQMYSSDGVAFDTAIGDFECVGSEPPGGDNTRGSNGLIGSLETNGQEIDEATLTEAQGDFGGSGNIPTDCADNSGLGPVQIAPQFIEAGESNPWTLSLAANGRVAITGGLRFDIRFTDVAIECVYGTPAIKGRVGVSPVPMRTALSFSRQKFELEGGSHICARTATLNADFYAYDASDQPLYDTN
jgi:hypothetical protein